MAAQAKYLFDQDFAAGAAEKAVAPTEHAILLGETESKGFRDGFAAAEKEGTAVAARRTAAALEQIGDALDRLARGLVAVEQRLETEAVALAVAVARKLAPELVLRQPFTEIAALATECFKQLSAAPHVVVRVNDALHQTARTQLDEIARTRGFEGRLVVLAEPEIALGDCKIEWADGGIVRNTAKTEIAIGNAIARYLGARPTAAMPELGAIEPGTTTMSQNHESEHE
jgi:flagellar assembly protein FliH